MTKDLFLNRECSECYHPWIEHGGDGSMCDLCDCEDFVPDFFPEE